MSGSTLKILSAAGSVREFLAGCQEESFVVSDLLRSAVLQKLTVIGEAAARVPDSLRKAHPEIPWSRIIRFRNIVVHAYFSIDWSIVWVAANEDVPRLAGQIRQILDEIPEDPAS